MWGNFSSPGAFALIGMAGLVAGVMNAPLTGMFLVFEISDSYGLILPLMVCSLTSMLVYRLLERGSIYTHDMLVHGRLMERGTGLHLLTEIGPEEIMERCPVLQGNTSLHDFLKRYGDNLPDHVAILDEADHFQGLVFLTDLKPILLEVELHHLIFLESLVDHQVPRLTSGFRPDEAALLFAKTSREALPVLAENGDFQGIVTKTLIFDSIRREIMVQD
jgi:CIC family chloride channel protein